MLKQITACLDSPKTYKELEAEVYGKNYPKTWESQLTLGLELIRAVNRGEIYMRNWGSKRYSSSVSRITCPVYCNHPIPPKFQAPFLCATQSLPSA